MKVPFIILHSLVLTAGNIVSIIVAFGFYSLLKQFYPPINQILVQAPVAAVLTVAGFTLWISLVTRYSPRFRLENSFKLEYNLERGAVFMLALLWTPVLFIPLHFFTQGYRTSIDNILAIWLFQVPVNLLALWFSRIRRTA